MSADCPLTGYRHQLDGEAIDLPLGKIVCIGRNYANHAKELNNPVPSEPILFIYQARHRTGAAGAAVCHSQRSRRVSL